jgi:hypothetical protein
VVVEVEVHEEGRHKSHAATVFACFVPKMRHVNHHLGDLPLARPVPTKRYKTMGKGS